MSFNSKRNTRYTIREPSLIDPLFKSTLFSVNFSVALIFLIKLLARLIASHFETPLTNDFSILWFSRTTRVISKTRTWDQSRHLRLTLSNGSAFLFLFCRSCRKEKHVGYTCLLISLRIFNDENTEFYKIYWFDANVNYKFNYKFWEYSSIKISAICNSMNFWKEYIF